MSNLGKWSEWYNETSKQAPYGDEMTYRMAAEWLKGLSVADWGCGLGWFRRFHEGEYVGIDGTANPFADIVADLTIYEAKSEGILIRHVMEHDLNWLKILANVIDAAQKRLVIIVFTPDYVIEGSGTAGDGKGKIIDYISLLGVHDICIPHDEIDTRLTAAGFTFTRSLHQTETYYKQETVWLAERQ